MGTVKAIPAPASQDKANGLVIISVEELVVHIRAAESTGRQFSVHYYSARVGGMVRLNCQSTYLRRMAIIEAHEAGVVQRMPERDAVPEGCVRVTPRDVKPSTGLPFCKDLNLDDIELVRYSGVDYQVQ